MVIARCRLPSVVGAASSRGCAWAAAAAALLCLVPASPSPALPPFPEATLILRPGVAWPPAEGLQGVDALVVPVLADGNWAVAPPPSPFGQASWARAAGEWVTEMETYHRAGIRVLGGIDLLRWSDSADSSRLASSHPEWFAVGADGSARSVEDPNAYVSVWTLAAPSLLVSLAGSLAERLPDLDGLVVRCEYSWRWMLGYEDLARSRYMLDSGRSDPRDLDLATRRPEQLAALRRWLTWREDCVTEALRLFSQTYRAHRPTAIVYAWGNAGLYLLPPADRGMVCAEWATWLHDGIVDRVFLEGPWTGRATLAASGARDAIPGLYASALGLLRRMAPVPGYAPVVSLPYAGGPPGAGDYITQLRREGAVPALAVVAPEDALAGEAVRALLEGAARQR